MGHTEGTVHLQYFNLTKLQIPGTGTFENQSLQWKMSQIQKTYWQ